MKKLPENLFLVWKFVAENPPFWTIFEYSWNSEHTWFSLSEISTVCRNFIKKFSLFVGKLKLSVPPAFLTHNSVLYLHTLSCPFFPSTDSKGYIDVSMLYMYVFSCILYHKNEKCSSIFKELVDSVTLRGNLATMLLTWCNGCDAKKSEFESPLLPPSSTTLLYDDVCTATFFECRVFKC